MVSQKLLPHKTNTVGKLRYKVASGYTVMHLFLDETVANGCFHDGVVRANNDLHVVGDEFPTGPISGIFVLCASLSCSRYLSSEIDFGSRLWFPTQIVWWIHVRKIKNRGVVIVGGRVTRFPFGPLNVFVYISHWAARVNSQNRPHFEGDYRNWWLTRALLDAIQLAASRSKMITYLCKIGTRYY